MLKPFRSLVLLSVLVAETVLPVAAATITNSAAIAIPGIGSATPYPSSITVSGATGLVSKVTVQLTGVSHTYPDDIDVLLVGPGGQSVILMSDVGGGVALNNATLTFDDAASASLPDATQISTGTYKPTNIGTGDTFASPAPSGNYSNTLSVFNGGGGNGVWSLYVVDDEANDQGSIAGGWTLTLTTGGNTPPTISSIGAQSTPTNTPTAAIPFTVGDLETAVTSLVVTAQSSNPALAPTNNIVFGGSGANRTVTVTPVAGQGGSATITLTVTDTSGATASTSFQLTVTSPGNFANNAAITIPSAGIGSPYPSVINVAGVAGTVGKVTVKLNSITHTYSDDIDIMLVGPGGQKAMLMSDAGGASKLNNVSLTFDDAAAAALSDSGSIATGTFKPTDYETGETFTAPAPAGPYPAALSVFAGGPVNGAWSLYVMDDTDTDSGSIAGGWSLTITPNAPTNTAPSIMMGPANLTVAVGANPSLTVVASGTGPLSYQWRKNGADLGNGGNISGATSSALSLASVQTNDTGNYQVVVTNVTGAVTSSVAVLTVLVPPTITGQPQSTAALAGLIATFSAAADGSLPLGYSWRLNGTALIDGLRITGATTSQLSIFNLQIGDAGNYTLVVTNAVGVVTSSVAVLTVNTPPGISNQPTPQTVAVGTGASFSVAASGTAPLSYQWRFNGLDLSNGGNVSGATSSALSLSNVQTNNAGGYQVVVANVAGSVTSGVAPLTVLVPPTITSQPQSVTNNVGGTAGFSATAGGSPTLGYAWRFNGSAVANGGRISGATTGNLTITNLQPTDAGNYTLVVTNSVGAVTSAVAVLTVNGPPSISSQPSPQTIVAGTGAGFNVTASGTAPLNYQWRLNGVNVANGANVTGATSSALALSNVQTNSAGNYQVVITNVAGSVTSAVAALTVIVPPSFTSQPLSATNPAGATAVFSANANGTAPLAFRWQFNGSALSDNGHYSGAAASSLSVSNVQAGDAGGYSLVVSNAGGAITSSVAVLTVLSAPQITGQPASQSVPSGSNVNFSVAASGTAPLGYQWRKGGVNLSNGGNVSGVTTATLGLLNVQSNDAGSFSVVVSNVAGSATSSVAALTVTTPGSCLIPGILAWWPGAGNANDSVGSANGVLQGGATATAPGVVGQAFGFDGTNSYVAIPDSPALRPTNLTVEGWVKFNSLDSPGSAAAGQQYLVFKQNTRTVSYFEGYALYKARYSPNDYFEFGVSSPSAQYVAVDSVTTVRTGVWYHVAAIRGSNYLQICVNGRMEAQKDITFAQDYGNFPLYFGSSGEAFWDRKLNGTLDEVSLYNRALSTNEIAAIYAKGSAGKCNGPAAPVIIVQPANQTLQPGGSTSFSVQAIGSAPLSFLWYKDGAPLIANGRISGVTNATLSITGLQITDTGNYQVVLSNSVGTALSRLALLSTGLPPTNDNFASAFAISGSTGSAVGNNLNGTKQSGEPNHAGNVGGDSVWFNWTAPSTSPVTFDTAISAFDTLLAVYTGSSVSGLTLIASNDNLSTNCSRSRVTFTPVSGTTYRIAVDGFNKAFGNFTLRWSQANTALPDLSVVGAALNPRITTETFDGTSCGVMEGLIQAGTRRLIRFDTETENSGTADLVFGDPSANPMFVWAPCHAHYHFQNYMAYRLRYSNGQIAATGLKVGFCVLDVFRWSSGGSGSAKYTCNNQGIQKGWGDLYDSTLDGQWIDITGLPDGNYVIEVEANPQGIIQETSYANNLTQIPITIGNASSPPMNDNFASTQPLLGTFVNVSGLNQNATKQAGEPNHAGNAGGKSLWYQWTAIDTKPVTIDTIGSSFNTLLAVYTGTSLGTLSLVASNDDIGPGTPQSSVTFNATAGTVYQIAVDGFNGASGNLILTLNQTIQNDNFANPQYIGGTIGTVYGSNAGATREGSEPLHAGNAGGASIWYAWTAPIGGTATFDTTGSTFNTVLGAYTGLSIDNLTTVAGNDDIGGGVTQSRVTFTATGLARYWIAIDGFNGATGDTKLNWNLTAVGSSAIAGTATLGPTPAALNFYILKEGELQLTIAGAPGQKYRIERSCDLEHWSPLITTLADTTGMAYFVDKATMHMDRQSATGDPVCGTGQISGTAYAPGTMRFYRATAMGVE